MEPALSVKMVSRDNTEMEKRAWKKNAVTTAYMSMPATGAREAGYGIEKIESDIDEIMEGFDDGHGIAPDGQEKLEDLISDSWEFAGELGKRDTGIIDIYMIAFKLAKKQLTDAEGKVC